MDDPANPPLERLPDLVTAYDQRALDTYKAGLVVTPALHANDCGTCLHKTELHHVRVRFQVVKTPSLGGDDIVGSNRGDKSVDRHVSSSGRHATIAECGDRNGEELTG